MDKLLFIHAIHSLWMIETILGNFQLFWYSLYICGPPAMLEGPLSFHL